MCIRDSDKLGKDYKFNFKENFEGLYIQTDDGIKLNGLLFRAHESLSLIHISRPNEIKPNIINKYFFISYYCVSVQILYPSQKQRKEKSMNK